MPLKYLFKVNNNDQNTHGSCTGLFISESVNWVGNGLYQFKFQRLREAFKILTRDDLGVLENFSKRL